MDFIGGLAVSILELVVYLLWWVIFDALPVIFYFTALALLFAVTFGKITVEFPKGMTRVGWTGLLQIRRSCRGHGEMAGTARSGGAPSPTLCNVTR